MAPKTIRRSIRAMVPYAPRNGCRVAHRLPVEVKTSDAYPGINLDTKLPITANA